MSISISITFSDVQNGSGVINVENKDIPLSNEGIQKAKEFLIYDIFQKINKVYSSTYLRAYQTATVFSKNIIQDERLIERLIGDSKTANKSQWKKQYDDHNYKNNQGESLNEVKQRMTNCINEILLSMKEQEKVLIVSHATSICSYLLNVCDIKVTNEKDRIRKIIFNNKIILEDKIQKPSCFILKYMNNQIIDIQYMTLM